MWGVGGYNTLVQKDTVIELKASNIEAQMKRRADLIPNLVSTVKGYASHEKEIYENIANARSRLLSANVGKNPQEAAAASRAFQGSLGRLLAVAENYPQLKADQNFIRLQDELTGTENRMGFARVQFNEAVQAYNLAVRTFPTSLIAGITGFGKKEPFEAEEADKAVPKVSFE
ncbi:MAG: LemA family protein [Cyanobacteria bacterium P01_H01_bin.74]